MIDFITLSRSPSNVEILRDSLRAWMPETLTWNLIVVDGTQHDLFSGYNLGAKQGKAEILAFVHDDVEILGNRLTLRRPLELLQDTSTGFIGVAGSRTLLEHACWWESHPESDGRGMAAHMSEHEFGLHWSVWPKSAGAGLFGRVAVLDGIFFMCRRNTFARLGGFDTVTYQGFHFYDIDITFRATLDGLVNYAAPIPLHHKGRGEPTGEWEANRQRFIKKFATFLPYRIT